MGSDPSFEFSSWFEQHKTPYKACLYSVAKEKDMGHLGCLFRSLFLINIIKTGAHPSQYPDYDADYTYSESHYQGNDNLYSDKD